MAALSGDSTETKFEFGIDAITEILPHRPPFLFVDGVVRLVPGKQIIAQWKISADEPFFAGHFPQKKIIPGVLICDALAQTSGLLWGLSKKVAGNSSGVPRLFYLASTSMKFLNPALPGDVVRLRSEPSKSFGQLFGYNVEAMAGYKLIAHGQLTLAMIEGDL